MELSWRTKVLQEQCYQSIPLRDAKAEYKIILKLVEGQELEDHKPHRSSIASPSPIRDSKDEYKFILFVKLFKWNMSWNLLKYLLDTL